MNSKVLLLLLFVCFVALALFVLDESNREQSSINALLMTRQDLQREAVCPPPAQQPSPISSSPSSSPPSPSTSSSSSLEAEAVEAGVLAWIRTGAGWHTVRKAFVADNAARKRESYAAATPPPKMCMLARTYKKQLRYLPTFLLSAAASGLDTDHFRVFLVVTDEPDTDRDDAVELVTDVARAISYVVGEPEFATVLPVPFSDQKNSGYEQTDAALRDYFYYVGNNNINQTSGELSRTVPGEPHTCDYLIVTNGDNYYSHGFALDLLKVTPQDLVMFDWISHYPYRPHINETRVFSDGSGRPWEAEPRKGGIDLGACMWRLQFLCEHRLFYAFDDGTWSPESDGHFVVKAVSLTNSWRRLAKTLFMHE